MSGKASALAEELALALEAAKQKMIWVKTAAGDVMEVEMDIALRLPVVARDLLHHPNAGNKDVPLQLPQQVGTGIFCLVLVYCRYHAAPGRSDKERKAYDDSFIRVDARRLCDLASAADALGIQPLVDLSSRALARMIEGRNPEDIRDMFHLPDDLTEEEKVQPIQNATDDPRIRLLNRLYARKRQEIASKKVPMLESPNAVGPSPAHDERPLEDLLSFIENGEADTKKSPAGKKFPESKRKKKGKGKPTEAEVAAAPGWAFIASDQSEVAEAPFKSRAELDETIASKYLEKIALIRQASAKMGSHHLVEQLMAQADSPDLTVEIQNLTEHLSRRVTIAAGKGGEISYSHSGAVRVLEEPSAEPLTLPGQQPGSSRQCTLTEPESVGRECPPENTSCRDDLEDMGAVVPASELASSANSVSSSAVSSDGDEGTPPELHRWETETETRPPPPLDKSHEDAGLVLGALQTFLRDAGLSEVLQVGWRTGPSAAGPARAASEDAAGRRETGSCSVRVRPASLEMQLPSGVSLTLKLDRDDINSECNRLM